MPTIDQVLNRRADLSTFIVHLTKEGQDKTAADSLESIVKEKKIEARSPLGWAKGEVEGLPDEARRSQLVVSFSEVPLEHVYSLFAQIEGRRVPLAPYGLVFTKMTARRKGVNPVWYVDMTPGREWKIAKALNELRDQALQAPKFWEHPAARIFPLVEGMGTWGNSQKEFWWEREWRHQGDFTFALEEVALVLCPEDDHQRFEALVPGKVVDPNWSLERMLAKLLGLAADAITPFAS